MQRELLRFCALQKSWVFGRVVIASSREVYGEAYRTAGERKHADEPEECVRRDKGSSGGYCARESSVCRLSFFAFPTSTDPGIRIA